MPIKGVCAEKNEFSKYLYSLWRRNIGHNFIAPREVLSGTYKAKPENTLLQRQTCFAITDIKVGTRILYSGKNNAPERD